MAKRNAGAGQSPRPPSTPTPTHTFNDVGDSRVPAEPVAGMQVPKSADDKDEASSSGVPTNDTLARGTSSPTHDAQVPKSTDGRNEASSSGAPNKTPACGTSTPTHTSNDEEDSHAPVDIKVLKSTDGKDEPIKTVAWGTPTPITTASASESGTSSSTDARRRLVPFEAFISPAQSRKSHVKSGDKHAADPFISPTAVRSRASMGGSASACFLGSQRPKGRVSGHGRRESASAAFEAYIVRDSPKQKTGARDADTRTIKPLSQPPRQPRFSEDSESLSVSSPVIPDAVPVPESESDAGSDGGVDDTNGMDVDAGDACVDSTRVDDGMASGDSEGEGEGEAEAQEEGKGQPDEADTLLELASVHLSQPEVVVDEEVPESPVDEADKVGDMGKVMDEVRSACVLCPLALLRGLVSRSWKPRSRGWLTNLGRKLGTRWLCVDLFAWVRRC